MRESSGYPSWVSEPGSLETQSRIEAYVEEHALTPEQRATSEARNRNYRQELADFEVSTPFVGEHRERLTPTPEQSAETDRQLIDLGRLFKPSGVDWKLDGAVNISIYRGAYIGRHKDVDVTVRPDQLEQLEAHLATQGYGLFLSEGRLNDDEHGSLVFQRTGAKGFREADLHHLIIAIDAEGKIRRDRPLNFVDLHLERRDEQGRALGYYDVQLPEEWDAPRPTTWNGEVLNLSHPVKVVYYKLHSMLPSRGYDLTDVVKLMDSAAWTAHDTEVLERVFEDEQRLRYTEAAEFVERMMATVTPATTQRDLEIEFLSDPEVESRVSRGMSADQIRSFAKTMFEALPKGIEEAKRMTLKAILANVQSEPQLAFQRLRQRLGSERRGGTK